MSSSYIFAIGLLNWMLWCLDIYLLSLLHRYPATGWPRQPGDTQILLNTAKVLNESISIFMKKIPPEHIICVSIKYKLNSLVSKDIYLFFIC